MIVASTVEDAEAWDSVSSRFDLWPLEQCHAYGEAARSIGQFPLRLRVDIAGETIQAQFLLRRAAWCLTLAQSIRGPLATSWHADTGRVALTALFGGLPVRWPTLILTMPEATNGASTDALLRPLGYRRVASPYHTALLDLRMDLSELRCRMWPAWRNRLASSQSSGLRIETAISGPLLDWVMRESLAGMRRRRVRGPSPTFARALTRTIGAGGALTVVATDDLGPCAGAIFLRHGPDATYWLSLTAERGRRKNAGNLVLWAAIEILKQGGIRLLDLGGVDTRRAPGISRFKLGLGAEPYSLSGTYA